MSRYMSMAREMLLWTYTCIMFFTHVPMLMLMLRSMWKTVPIYTGAIVDVYGDQCADVRVFVDSLRRCRWRCECRSRCR